MEYKIDDRHSLKGGFKYTEGAPDKKGLNPSSNDVDVLASVIGVGYKITHSLEMNIALMYIYGFEISYDSKKYDVDHPSVILGVRYMPYDTSH